MSHKTNVPVINLQIDMFVSDLDRPWIETPFLLQGFVIENDAEIATLREFAEASRLTVAVRSVMPLWRATTARTRHGYRSQH